MLVADVHGDDALLGHRPSPLERGDRLADAWLAAEQHDLAGADPAGQHVVEAIEARGQHGLLRRRVLDLMELGERGERRADPRTLGGARRAWRLRLQGHLGTLRRIVRLRLRHI